MLRTLLAFCAIFCMGVCVYAFDSIQDEQPDQAPISCLAPFVSGAVLRISEIGFDGTDERIEITNIGDVPFQDTLIISGAKSKTLTYPNFLLPAGEVIIIGDTLSHFTGDIPVFATGQGLSLPDTTGFSLVLFTVTGILDSVSFSPDAIFSIPNGVALEALFSGDTREWIRGDETRTILGDSFANPGNLYCLSPVLLSGDSLFSGDNQNTGNAEIPDDLGTGNSGENLVLTGFEDTGDDLGDSGTGNEVLVDLTGLNNSGISMSPPQTGYLDLGIPLINQNLDHTNTVSPCAVSEIHSVAGVLPEYTEVFCQRAFSGTLVFSGLGVGASVKSITLNINTGSYAVFASDVSAFYDTGGVYILPGISLLDAGETITLMISGYNSLSYTYSVLEKNSSYYPVCGVGSSCVGLTSPGFSYFYIAGYTDSGPISTVVSSSSDSAQTTSTNTYYQGLYQTRKAKAVQYEKDISGLKKTVTTLQKQTKTISTGSGNSTKVVKKAIQATSKTARTSVKSTSKSNSPAKTTTPKTASKTPAKTTTKTTKKAATPKAKTVSTSSKAYVLLVDEHKVYKAYTAFLHDYLQDHLFGQYKALKIPNIESLLKKSLQAVKKQKYAFALITGTSLSPFDFQTQWKTINQTKSLDLARNPLAATVLSVLQRMPISFLEKLYTKHTLLVGSILSRSDI